MSSVRHRKPNRASPASLPSQLDTETEDEPRRRDELAENPFIPVLKVLILLIGINFLVSYYITSTFFWNNDFRLLRPRYRSFALLKALHQTGIPEVAQSALLQVLPKSSPILASTFFTFTFPRVFSDATLALYDGSNPDLPIYVGLNGSVYDVTENGRTYGPGGPYHHFAGRDAARAFVTGCFTTDLTHDLRGLDPVAADKDIAGWKDFFEKSARYWYVGDVFHPAITGPPPGECQGPKRSGV
ncbi:cytochrome b5-like heme/steroid binding domain-containing protein [Lipomyces tetrasporus]|uniref:Cytochrome b5-like heme/steroid binding domain-containing protein n=1 Tax=Lipomyces tetrasporus TaxID=54092 RepID=A0AAD7QL82_9ASCO|nr:cytochrome b5-like heme/steroid binding domain-containing protein [Lipomyces tetrasporus]KAJ8097020.1 cytochrome b5-like heme/steroid binding domain-containing protein [Lipomyces tetrasporus]